MTSKGKYPGLKDWGKRAYIKHYTKRRWRRLMNRDYELDRTDDLDETLEDERNERSLDWDLSQVRNKAYWDELKKFRKELRDGKA